MPAMSTTFAPPARRSFDSAESSAPAALRHTSPAVRFVGVAGIAAIAATHLIDLPGKMEEVKYLGAGYVLLIIGLVYAAVEIVRDRRSGWAIGGALALATLVGFILSRTTGLPQATDDVGNWSEGLGLISMLAEAALVGLAMGVLGRAATRQ
jgi:hypothetical protein